MAVKPFQEWRDGAWRTTYGWLDLRRHLFPPPLGARWVSSCDIPDPHTLSEALSNGADGPRFTLIRERAGHLVVCGLAGWCVCRLLRRLTPFAAPLSRISHWIEPLLSDQGGMFVALAGEGLESNRLCVSWNSRPPESWPVHSLRSRYRAGAQARERHVIAKGAMPCVGLLTVQGVSSPLAQSRYQGGRRVRYDGLSHPAGRAIEPSTVD